MSDYGYIGPDFDWETNTKEDVADETEYVDDDVGLDDISDIPVGLQWKRLRVQISIFVCFVLNVCIVSNAEQYVTQLRIDWLANDKEANQLYADSESDENSVYEDYRKNIWSKLEITNAREYFTDSHSIGITTSQIGFTIPDGTYNYAPSVVVDGNVQAMFYSSNSISYEIATTICYSDFVYDKSNALALLNRKIILEPTEGAWDSVHISDPSVIAGEFWYQGKRYQYLMAYSGCNTLDNTQSQIGLAVSNQLDGNWIKIDANPIIRYDYDTIMSDCQWYVGQPSLISLDKKGCIILFYTKVTSTETYTMAEEWDFSNLDSPVMTKQQKLVTAGVKGLNSKMDFISNADFAYCDGVLYMVCDVHPFSDGVLNMVSDIANIYARKWDGDVNNLYKVMWSERFSITEDQTSYHKIHNCGFYRTLYGDLADNGVIYTSAVELDDFKNSLWTYRLQSLVY